METGRFWPICPFGARNGHIQAERDAWPFDIRSREFLAIDFWGL